jgi:hypothetical protein
MSSSTSPFPHRDAEFIELWNEGLSVSEIGRRMGVTKATISGRSYKLQQRGVIKGRVAPIERSNATPAEKKQKRLAYIAEWSRRKRAAAGAKPQPKLAQAPELAPEPAPQPQPATPPARRTDPVARGCQWIVSNGRPWVFCDQPATHGPYCEAHWKVGHVQRAAVSVEQAEEIAA